MTQCLSRPSYLACCGREISTDALLLATAFFVDCLKISSAKDVSTARNRQS